MIVNLSGSPASDPLPNADRLQFLVFVDESVLQSTEGVQHELKPFVKLRERWGRAPRDRLSGADLKPVRAAAVKSRGSERRIKSSDQTEQVSVRKTNESEPSDDASL
jgi:hypothetical protein